MLRISELYIYPIKSLGGIAVNHALVTDRGLKYDRRWMLVDDNNIFISQRKVARMALMRLQLVDNGIQVSYLPDNRSFTIPFKPVTNEFADVMIWEDTCKGHFVSQEADKWFSDSLEIPCRLVYMPDETKRLTDEQYTSEKSITSFSDAYPFLIIGESSLEDLNNRLEVPVTMDRFRPNIVFTGGKPFEEDLMHTLTIGQVTFNGVKLCARCVITTIDQNTALNSPEPLKTLAKYRFKNNKILFGQNLVHKGTGEIKVGDEIEVLKLNNEDRFSVAPEIHIN